MSHIKVKTKYKEGGPYGSTEDRILYCHHNLSCDTIVFYNEMGECESMCFDFIGEGTKWDAMNKLMFPFKKEWGAELLDGVEYYYEEVKNV